MTALSSRSPLLGNFFYRFFYLQLCCPFNVLFLLCLFVILSPLLWSSPAFKYTTSMHAPAKQMHTVTNTLSTKKYNIYWMSLCRVSIWALSLLIVRLCFHLPLSPCVCLSLLSAFSLSLSLSLSLSVRACTTEEDNNIIHIIRDPLCGARRRCKEEIALGLSILSTSAWPAYTEHLRLSSVIRYAEQAQYYDLEWSENPPLKPLWPARSHTQIQCEIHAAYPESMYEYEHHKTSLACHEM